MKIVVGGMRRSGREGSCQVFWRYLIRSGNGKTSASSNQLMFRPFFFEVVQPSPERCHPSFDLPKISLSPHQSPKPHIPSFV